MTNHDGIWVCPTCGAKAQVAGRHVTVTLAPTLNPHWPLHFDCELAKDLDHVDFGKLTKVG